MPTTNSLPTITVNFLQQAMTAVARSGSGIMALCLKVNTPSQEGVTETAVIYEFYSAADVDGSTVVLTDVHKQMCKNAFIGEGSPKKLIVSVNSTPVAAFTAIKDMVFSWVCYGAPYVAAEATAFRTAVDTFNSDATNARQIMCMMCDDALTASVTDDHYVGVERATLKFSDNTTLADTLFYQFLPCICGIAASTDITQSFTYRIINNVTSAVNTATPAANIVYLTSVDGYVRISRAITAAGTSVALREAKNIINEDIVLTWRNYYLGKMRNTKTNELSFCAQILGYLKELQSQGVISEDEIVVEQDIAGMRNAHASYYAGKTNEWVAAHPYGTECRVRCEMRLVDTMEDLIFNIYLGA